MRALAAASVATVLALIVAPQGHGGGYDCTIRGTDGPEVIRGTPSFDVICAGAGDDVLIGLGRTDVLRGGPGADRIDGGRGRDYGLGGGGDDALDGGPGADALDGGPGTDACEGGGGTTESFDRSCERKSNCENESAGKTPLSDLGRRTYRGLHGGLYGGGRNARPAGHEAAGVAIAGSIGPLSPAGAPDPGGRYALISIGPSLARQEFQPFIEVATRRSGVDPDLALVNGAQDHVTADRWADPGDPAWDVLTEKLLAAGVFPSQVAVAWVKLAVGHPTGGWPDHVHRLERQTAATVRILHDRFPNLRLAYLSSRTYAGYATYQLSFEPYAYESAFAARAVIRGQIAGERGLNYSPGPGAVKAPWLSWGPYLWADGMRPRGDGLVWRCRDFAGDGIHPSPGGAGKVAAMLLGFFTADPTASPWFLAD